MKWNIILGMKKIFIPLVIVENLVQIAASQVSVLFSFSTD